MMSNLLSNFEKIDRGKQLSVAHADYTKNLRSLVECPVYQEHSLNRHGRDKMLLDIDRKNVILMKKLEKPNHTVKNQDLRKRWKEKVVLHNKMRISNRPGVEEVNRMRQKYLSSRRRIIPANLDEAG